MAAQENSVVVVGTDGSEHADRALAWAGEEARLRGATVRVVTAWHVPVAAYGGGYAPIVSPSLDEAAEAGAKKVAGAAAEKLRGQGLEVEVDVRQGQAADALVDSAKDAALLVVGSRGHGGFTNLLLGSVGQQCAHHAPCPVVIVR
jgi:nucleotide-binding universal stress UspA family protein